MEQALPSQEAYSPTSDSAALRAEENSSSLAKSDERSHLYSSGISSLLA